MGTTFNFICTNLEICIYLQNADSTVLSTTDIVIVLENSHTVCEEPKVENDIWIENEETCI